MEAVRSAVRPLEERLMHLENQIITRAAEPHQEETDMAKKIRRPYTINGAKVWITGNTEQEVLDNAIRMMGLVPAAAPEKSKTNFGQYARNWFETYSKPNVATVTATTYDRQLRLYILPALKDKNVEDITSADVQGIFNSMDGTKATKDKCKVVLNMILKMAVEDELMKRNPLESSSFRLRGEASKTTPPYTVEEMRQIVEGIGKLTNPTDRAYLALHSLHPLRLEEVLGLRWKDVSETNMTLHICTAVTHPTRNAPEIKGTKTGKERDIALSQVAWKHLQEIGMGQPDEFIVGGKKPLSYTQVEKMCTRIAKEIDFKGKITPRRFRATVLTDIYEQTGDIKLTQQAAGHATADMTLKHYVQTRRKSSETADAIDSLYAAAT